MTDADATRPAAIASADAKRAANVALYPDVETAIRSVDHLIYQGVLRHFPKTHPEHEEVAQRVRLHLWVYAWPRYNPSVGKWSTLAFVAIGRCVASEVRRVAQASYGRRAHCEGMAQTDLMCVTGGGGLASIASPDHTGDRRIERVAADVLRNPEKYLTDSQAIVFRAVVGADPATEMRQIARKLGYGRPSSLSMMLRRIKERIAEISIEDFEVEGSTNNDNRAAGGEGGRRPLTSHDAASDKVAA